MPGRKDVKSVKQVGDKRIRVQKRLQLMNIEELYFMYKEYSTATLQLKPCGRTVFYQLRPQHVIEVGVAGTHSVCVCEKHQNVKLMIDILCKKEVVAHMFMDKVVCDVDNHVCMVTRCISCPPSHVLRTDLLKHLSDRNSITFNQWESTDRTTLALHDLPAEEFIDELAKKINKLTKHHFVAKKQARYC